MALAHDADHSYDAAAMDLVGELAELPEGERLPKLDAVCGGDHRLRARVLTLLGGLSPAGASEHDRSGARAAADASDAGHATEVAKDAPAPNLPERFGPYRIVGLLGEGGMGVVYEAEQEHPRRRVALKVLPPMSAGRSLVRRFELEASVLGRLEHPGIARVYEAGTAHADGRPRPFFAMELVRGASLTAHADAARLPARERLDLLARVCDAVQHAHQKGVIHRDLKPANILVDASGQPKVLDFGVARLTDADVAHTLAPSASTASGQIIGTLQYMSPEQAAGDISGLDTRADVYALGVIAYELLAGRPPYDARTRALLDVLRAIREEEPRPLGALDRALRGDVETIVAKAMAKEKERRYAGAAELAADVRRLLNYEPVAARPASAWYHARKFARRNRTLVVAAMAVVAALVGGIIGTSVQALRATRAEAATAAERDRTLAQRREAERQRQAAQDGVTFLSRMIYTAADRAAHASGPADRAVVRRLLDEAARELDAAGAQTSWAAGQIHATLGNAYFSLGLTDEARLHLDRAVEISRATAGELSPATLRNMTDLANAIKAVPGPEAAARAESLLLDVLPLQEQVLGPDDAVTSSTLYALGNLLQDADRLPEAEARYRQALAGYRASLGDRHDQTLLAWQNLAAVLRKQGRSAEAVDTLREGLGRQAQAPANDSLRVRLVKLALADMLAATAPAEASRVYADVFAQRTGRWSQQDRGFRSSAARYADLLDRTGRAADAKRLRDELASDAPPAK